MNREVLLIDFHFLSVDLKERVLVNFHFESEQPYRQEGAPFDSKEDSVDELEDLETDFGGQISFKPFVNTGK